MVILLHINKITLEKSSENLEKSHKSQNLVKILREKLFENLNPFLKGLFYGVQ